jgi:hypothetical protein
MNHRFTLAYATLLLAAYATWADEAYVIKTNPERKVGRRTQLSQSTTSDERTALIDGRGKALEDTKESLEQSLVVEETIVALKAGTKRPEKLELKFEKLKCKRNGEAIDDGLEGRTVVALLKDKDYALSIKGGGTLKPEATLLLKSNLLAEYLEDEEDFVQLCLPDKPVRVGDTWTCNIQVIAADIEKREGFKIDVAKAKGTGKLLKASRKDGHTFGAFEITIDLPLRQFTDLDGGKVRVHEGSKSKMQYSYVGCIDGSVNEGVMTVTMEELVKHESPKVKGATVQFSHKTKCVTESKEVASK